MNLFVAAFAHYRRYPVVWFRISWKESNFRMWSRNLNAPFEWISKALCLVCHARDAHCRVQNIAYGASHVSIIACMPVAIRISYANLISRTGLEYSICTAKPTVFYFTLNDKPSKAEKMVPFKKESSLCLTQTKRKHRNNQQIVIKCFWNKIDFTTPLCISLCSLFECVKCINRYIFNTRCLLIISWAFSASC